MVTTAILINNYQTLHPFPLSFSSTQLKDQKSATKQGFEAGDQFCLLTLPSTAHSEHLQVAFPKSKVGLGKFLDVSFRSLFLGVTCGGESQDHRVTELMCE